MSLLELVLATDLERIGIPHEREYRFAPPRKWRADFLLPGKVLVEVEGGAWDGRHTRGGGFIKDAEKYAAAARLGYIVLRFTSPQVQGRMMPGSESEAVETIKAAMKYWGSSEARKATA